MICDSELDVARYYDEMQRFYSYFWHPSGVHYGLSSVARDGHDAAVRRMDALVAEVLALPRGSHVLDAGCGVGGTSFFLAREHGHRVSGVTLSRAQLARAQSSARSVAPELVPRFYLRRYSQTGFDDGSFDGVFGIESVCYAFPKRDFIEEARRVLRPSGMLVVVDGFAGSSVDSEGEREIGALCAGFALPELVTGESFAAALRDAGFVDVAVRDLSSQVMPSARRILALSLVGSALTHLAPWAPMRRTWKSHCRAGIAQYRLLRRGGMRYLLVTARRPALRSS